MCRTFTCIVKKDFVEITDSQTDNPSSIARDTFEKLISRRQRSKLSIATRLAGSMYTFVELQAQIENRGGDTQNTPIVIFNRFANWDYVADTMSQSQKTTLDGVNNYVATAWFPAAIQGYLTIENGNKGEAITIATQDIELKIATIDALFLRNEDKHRTGTLIVGTFECLPNHIGTQKIIGSKAAAFGAFTLISADDSVNDIRQALETHQELYRHVIE